MKFGKYLASRQLELPEYSGHFIDYKALKKLIKQLAIPSTAQMPATQDEIQKTLKENKASFFFKVERELEKVNSFYLEKQANLAINLDLRLMERNELFSSAKEFLEKENEHSTFSFNLKNSITYLNLYQNFKKLHQDLLRLQQFIELNETGFAKVVKKWDKRSKSHTKELFIATAVSVQPVFHKNEINELSDLVTSSLFDLESIIDGDISPIVSYSSPSNHHQQNLINSLSRFGSRSNYIKDMSSTPASISQLTADGFDPNSTVSVQNAEIDELYTTFVNLDIIEGPDMHLLNRWMDKVKNSAKNAVGSDDPNELNKALRIRYSKVLLLSITNLKISDNFLENFLEAIDYNISFLPTSDNFNNNKNIFHECCSIPPSSTHEDHLVINNGVKVVKSADSIEHSRIFIVKRGVNTLSPEDLKKLFIGKDFNGRNCLHYASQYNRIDLLDIILPSFSKEHLDDLDSDSMSPILLAIKHQNFQVIMKLVQMGSNYYPKNNDSTLQYLPINYACKIGDYQTVEYLLSYKKPNLALINSQDVEGLAPLHVVARSGHANLIPLLVQFGADVNQIDSLNKWTPLFYAVAEGHLQAVKALVKFGARVDMIDEDGYNVVYYCVVEGHIDVLNELLTYYSEITGERSPASSSLIKKEPSSSHVSKKSKSNAQRSQTDNAMSILDDEEDSEDSGDAEKNVDAIPDLQLPPPILPMRRYGHNFLEQKVLIELVFPNNSNFVNLFNSSTGLKPGRITLSSNISDIVPRNIILPAAEETRVSNCIFQTNVDSLNDFRIDFEIFPKFGTRLIAKTTALSFSQIDTSSPEINSLRLPLFDLRLKNIGEIKFNCQVIFPFSGILLETSKFDTYWKSSTTFVKNKPSIKLNAGGGLSPSNYLSPSSLHSTVGDNLGSSVTSTNELVSGSAPSSFVTATSLSGEYLRIKVCLLNDGTPIVCPHWSISITDNIDLYLPNLSLEQLTSITENLFDYGKALHDLAKMTVDDIDLIRRLLKIIYLPLESLLQILNVEINLNLEIIFPSEYEIRNLPFVANVSASLNNFIDYTLNDVFNHLRAARAKNQTNRSIIFMSSNSLICKILNWKQPNFAVFLVMNGITYNIETKNFESRSTNGLLLEPSESETQDAQDKNFDKLIENDQERTSKSIKDAVNFAVNNNLIGLITSIHLLKLVPKLVPLIRSRGLVLVATNDSFQDEDPVYTSRQLDVYTKTEINGLRFDDILTFKEDITM